jgi:hypothetical protein
MRFSGIFTSIFFAFSVGLTGAAYAQENDGAGNSDSGIDRYNEIAQNPNPDAQCGTGGGSGAFGYFGTNLNLGINDDPEDPGADGYQTGLNNSAVCGNRQSPD